MMMRGKLFIAGLIFLGIFGTIANADITDGLVSHWSFDEGSGTIANDSAGTNTGTLVNGPAWTTGKVGGALCFGGSRYVDIGNDASLRVDSVTLETWIKVTDSWGAHNPIIGSNWDGVGSNYYLGVVNGQFGFTYVHPVDPYWRYCSTTPPSNDGLWHHVVGTFDAGISKIYIDGVLRNTCDYSSVTTVCPKRIDTVYIGQFWAGGYGVPGDLDEVAIYDRALSESEIQSHYSKTKDGAQGYCETG